MKALLINPKQGINVYSKYDNVSPILPPLGLLYLGGVLRGKKVDIILIDNNVENLSMDDLIQKIKKEKPDFICLTSSTSVFNEAKNIASAVKEYDKKIKILLGGSHISILPEKTIIECPNIDVGCIGESERTIKELVDYLMGKKELRSIKGIIYKSGKKIIKTNNRSLLKNLDTLPLPAFDLIKDITKYSHSPPRSRKKFFHLVTSRGCNYNCIFCDQGVFSNHWRAHSAKRIIEMIKILKREFKTNYISFEDDDFAIDNKRVIELCKLIVNEKIKIKWGCSLNLKDIKNEKLLKKMSEAGCELIYTGIESGSEKILKKIGKTSSKEIILKKIKMMKKNNINVYGSFILGFPFESKEDIQKTINFAKKLPLSGVTFHIFTPYPKTIIYKNYVKKKEISKEWERYSGHNSEPIILNKSFSKEFILRKQKEAYIKFYIRPKYIINNLNHILKGKYLRKSLNLLVKFIIK